MNEPLKEYITKLEPGFTDIPEDRLNTLEALGDQLIRTREEAGENHLVFICTHNSRRSHMGQIWARTAALHYGLEDVYTYSGGTASTEFNTRAVAAIERAGFSVEKKTGTEANPRYLVSPGPDFDPALHFSKVFDDPANPGRDFTAVMVCSQADEACPFVPGAEARFAIPFEDPKAFDGTDREPAMYDERCRQIATELFYVFHYATSAS